jgi:hypothetical protein
MTDNGCWCVSLLGICSKCQWRKATTAQPVSDTIPAPHKIPAALIVDGVEM